VDADKQYQLADWRLRPLGPQMARYAREDTHYLLYVYDELRLELLRRQQVRWGCTLPPNAGLNR
jgi:exosome complex exonuclease RRP6